ncbi:hypothetical protein V8J88_13250 [Massilia sp. W12]|uniref:hypothetical protein n=1 Tax=Massilia sp. W12 TaxID=3126507 RepID=UPI0030CAB811
MFPLSTISDWLTFLPSVDGELEHGEWIIRIHSFSDDKASLVFEKEFYESNKHAPGLTKYILTTPAGKNHLLHILHFLESNEFNLQKILSSLEGMEFDEVDEVCLGKYGDYQFMAMKFEAR